MRRLTWICLGILAALAALPVRADIYRGVSADGTVILTNVYRRGHNYVRIRSTPKPPPARARPVAAARSLQAQALAGKLPYAAQVAAAAAEHELPEALLHAVIRTESNYDPRAISGRGAIGLMQLMPDTARELGVADPWDPAANIRGGARYLKRLLAMFDNDLQLALAAYNAGPGAVLSRGRTIPPYAETRSYVPRVIEHFNRLQASGR